MCGVVPVFNGVEEKVTEAPLQNAGVLVETVMAGVTVGVTVIVTLLEVSLLFVAHGAFESKIMLRVSLFAKLLVVKFIESVPTSKPFFLQI